jgi:hypothetical protein
MKIRFLLPTRWSYEYFLYLVGSSEGLLHLLLRRCNYTQTFFLNGWVS